MKDIEVMEKQYDIEFTIEDLKCFKNVYDILCTCSSDLTYIDKSVVNNLRDWLDSNNVWEKVRDEGK